MRIWVNGKELQIDEGSTVLDLLQRRGIRPEVVVVELNDRIIPRERYGEVSLKEGDRLELVYYMGGG